MTNWMKRLRTLAPLSLGACVLALAAGCNDGSNTVEETDEPASPTPAPVADADVTTPAIAGNPASAESPSPPATGADVVDDRTAGGPAERAGAEIDSGLDRAGSELKEGANEAGAALRRGAAKTREAVQEGANKVKEAVDIDEATGAKPADDAPADVTPAPAEPTPAPTPNAPE